MNFLLFIWRCIWSFISEKSSLIINIKIIDVSIKLKIDNLMKQSAATLCSVDLTIRHSVCTRKQLFFGDSSKTLAVVVSVLPARQAPYFLILVRVAVPLHSAKCTFGKSARATTFLVCACSRCRGAGCDRRQPGR